MEPNNHEVFSSAFSLISFYGWRYRNSCLILMICPRISGWTSWYSWRHIWKILFSPQPCSNVSNFFNCLFLRVTLRKAANSYFQRYFQFILSSAPTSTIWHLWRVNPWRGPPLHGEQLASSLHHPGHPAWPTELCSNHSFAFVPRSSLSLSVPYYSVGKAITLVKYNCPWILSLRQRNWPNLRK